MKTLLHTLPIKPDYKNKGRAGVYMWINILNLKMYVGSATNLYQRQHHHLTELRYGKSECRILQSAFLLYKEHSFRFIVLDYITDEHGILAEGLNWDDLIYLEQYWMDYFQSFNNVFGYNIAPIAGSSLGIKFSDEFREMRRRLQTGVKLSLATRLKMSIAASNKVKSAEHLKNISIALSGRKLSLKHRENLTGKKRSVESRQKMRIARLAYLERQRLKKKLEEEEGE